MNILNGIRDVNEANRRAYFEVKEKLKENLPESSGDSKTKVDSDVEKDNQENKTVGYCQISREVIRAYSEKLAKMKPEERATEKQEQFKNLIINAVTISVASLFVFGTMYFHLIISAVAGIISTALVLTGILESNGIKDTVKKTVESTVQIFQIGIQIPYMKYKALEQPKEDVQKIDQGVSEKLKV